MTRRSDVADPSSVEGESRSPFEDERSTPLALSEVEASFSLSCAVAEFCKRIGEAACDRGVGCDKVERQGGLGGLWLG